MADMTPKEAVEIIKWVPLYRYECELEKGRQSDLFKALNNGLEALEKQIPKKPVMLAMDGFDFGVAAHECCPSCKQGIVNVWNKAKYEPRFCHYCGQALDWSDRDE